MKSYVNAKKNFDINKIVKLFIKIFLSCIKKNSNNWMGKNFFKHLEAIKILEKKKLNLVVLIKI